MFSFWEECLIVLSAVKTSQQYGRWKTQLGLISVTSFGPRRSILLLHETMLSPLDRRSCGALPEGTESSECRGGVRAGRFVS